MCWGSECLLPALCPNTTDLREISQELIRGDKSIRVPVLSYTPTRHDDRHDRQIMRHHWQAGRHHRQTRHNRQAWQVDRQREILHGSQTGLADRHDIKAELRNYVKVEVDVLGSPSLTFHTVSVEVKHHWRRRGYGKHDRQPQTDMAGRQTDMTGSWTDKTCWSTYRQIFGIAETLEDLVMSALGCVVL